jgi:hypothetical protein
MLLATEPVKAKSNRESHFEETNHPLPCVHSALHFQGIATPPTEEWQKHFSALFLCSVSPTRRQHRLTKPPPQRRAPPPAAVSAAPRHVLAPQGEQGWRGRLLCPVSAPRACACGARRDGRRGDGWGHVRHCRSSSTPSSSSWGEEEGAWRGMGMGTTPAAPALALARPRCPSLPCPTGGTSGEGGRTQISSPLKDVVGPRPIANTDAWPRRPLLQSCSPALGRAPGKPPSPPHSPARAAASSSFFHAHRCLLLRARETLSLPYGRCLRDAILHLLSPPKHLCLPFAFSV